MAGGIFGNPLTGFSNLRGFVAALEARGDLHRIKVPVNPVLEMTEITLRSLRAGGPALLFEKVEGSPFPLLINAFATPERVALALGKPPAEFGADWARAAEDFQPPRLGSFWRQKGVLARLLSARVRRVSGGPVLQVTEAPDLGRLPVLKCWPKDGGRFMTWPLVSTQHPLTQRRNLGVYRLQVFDNNTTGMHWQIERGGGFHYAVAEERGERLPVAVTLGADPISLLAGVFPLPEDVEEWALAGYLRGQPTRLVRLSNGIDVPAEAEFVLEGFVPPGERRQEGPFGDHFGHYSQAAPFPLFHVEKLHRRAHPIYPATVVGKPPQEDKAMGIASQELFLPLLKILHPELKDLWAYHEAGFHNLAVAAVKQRYAREGLKTALGLLGAGQMSLSKCVFLVDPGVPVKNFRAVLRALKQHFNPAEDFLLLPGTSQDTLDFTSFKMNLGSKMIIDATANPTRPAPPSLPTQPEAAAALPGVTRVRDLEGALLVVQVNQPGRPILEKLVQHPALAGYSFIATVSEDVPLDDDELLLWGLFTRFDCARDVTPKTARLKGAWAEVEGPLGLEATWKPGYPDPLTMDPAITARVSQRWKEFGF